jgi:aspartate racemase
MINSMKPIGIIGGVSWESTAEYYRLFNEAIKSRLGPKHSAELIIYSLDFAPVALLENEEKWDELATLLTAVGQRLESAGAACLVVASNTLHKVASELQANLQIPLVHIADSVANEIQKTDMKTIGLLGTRFVMEQDFFRERLAAGGLSIIVPSVSERAMVHDVIFNELVLGKITDHSRHEVLKIIDQLNAAGAEGVILACTELPLLIRPIDTAIRLFDSMAIHVNEAVSLTLT